MNPFGNVDNIYLYEYNPAYPEQFETESLGVKAILGENLLAIHHIGSTAIPGMIGKPVIDMGAVVREFPIRPDQIAALTKAGYIYWDANPDPSRMFFLKGMPRTHHLHIYPEGSAKPADQVLFRDFLNKNGAYARQYAELKTQLAAQYSNDREKYTESKTGFVQQVLKAAKTGSGF